MVLPTNARPWTWKKQLLLRISLSSESIHYKHTDTQTNISEHNLSSFEQKSSSVWLALAVLPVIATHPLKRMTVELFWMLSGHLLSSLLTFLLQLRTQANLLMLSGKLPNLEGITFLFSRQLLNSSTTRQNSASNSICQDFFNENLRRRFKFDSTPGKSLAQSLQWAIII